MQQAARHDPRIGYAASWDDEFNRHPFGSLWS